MSKSTKNKLIVEDVETQTKLPVASIMITALDPVYGSHGQLNHRFKLTLDGTDYNFRTNTQGELELNNSGIFVDQFILNE